MKRIDIARLFLFVREAAEPNTGLRVEAIQFWCGGEKGESWCCYFVSLVLDLEYQGNAPIERTGVCQRVYDLAQANGWIIAQPELGCLVLTVNADNHAHHIAICTGVQGGRLTVIAGNTSADGVSSNGTGVFEHDVSQTGKVFVRVPAV